MTVSKRQGSLWLHRRRKITYTGIERRKFKRLNTPLPVQFSLVSGEISEPQSGAIIGRTRDVSGEGLCLETNAVIRDRRHILAEAMGGEKRLRLAIEIFDREGHLEVLGRVVWYDIAPEDSDFRFRAGIFFTEMDDEVRKEWRGFLLRAKKRRPS